MKITALILSLLFVLFAGFQYNDLDGWIWTLAYGNIAVLCFMAFLGKYYRIWSILSVLVYAAYFIYLSPAVFEFFSGDLQGNVKSEMSFEKEYIEKTREAGGLLIALLALTFLHFASRKR